MDKKYGILLLESGNALILGTIFAFLVYLVFTFPTFIPPLMLLGGGMHLLGKLLIKMGTSKKPPEQKVVIVQ